MVVALKSRNGGSNTPSIMGSVVDEERMRPGHWLGLVFYIFTVLWHWWFGDMTRHYSTSAASTTMTAANWSGDRQQWLRQSILLWRRRREISWQRRSGKRLSGKATVGGNVSKPYRPMLWNRDIVGDGAGGWQVRCVCPPCCRYFCATTMPTSWTPPSRRPLIWSSHVRRTSEGWWCGAGISASCRGWLTRHGGCATRCNNWPSARHLYTLNFSRSSVVKTGTERSASKESFISYLCLLMFS